MKQLSQASFDAFASGSVAMILLVEMQFTSTIRLASSSVDVFALGQTWLGAGSLGAVDQIESTSGGQFASLKFTLSGVPTENIALALNEPIRGRPVFVWQAIMDAQTNQVLDTFLIWSGTADQMPISVDGQTSTIDVVCEHAGSIYARPKPQLYTDADQQRLFPGDTSLRFIPIQSQHQDIWPAAGFFRT